jgi:uncharacterized membrane protein
MNRFNPVALIFWALCALAGFLIGGITGAEIGLVIALAISLGVCLL